MKLIYDLPANAKKVVHKQILNESILICLPFDISPEGNYIDGWFVVSESYLIIVRESNIINQIKLSNKQKFKVEIAFGIAYLEIEDQNETNILINFSMQYIESYRFVAIILNNRKEEAFHNNIETINQEKFCPICNSALMEGSNICPKCSSKRIFFNKIKFLLSKHFKTILLILLFTLTLTAIATVKPYIFAVLIDDYLIPLNRDIKGILTIGAFLIIIEIFKVLIEVLKKWVALRMGKSISSEVRNKIYEKIMRVSLKYLDRKSTGDLVERINQDVNILKDFIVNDIPEIFNQIITFLLVSIVMLLLNWRVALLAFICLPLILFISYKMQYIFNEIAHKKLRLNDNVISFLFDILKGIKVVKIFNKEEKSTKSYEQENFKLNKVELSNEKIYSVFSQLMTIIFSISKFSIVLFTGTWVIQNTITLGEMTQFIQYSDLLYGPILWLASFPKQLMTVMSSTERIFDVLDQKDEVILNKGKKIDIVGNVKLEHVYFGYDSIHPVLKDICLDVKVGETIGLVGISGMGKTTLINLIMKLYNVDSGSIEIDDVNINDIDSEYFRKSIGVVLQDSFLVSGTIRENIAYSRPDASLEEVIKAAKAAYAHDFIMNMPDSYDTFVGDLGNNLSGGERQRICIARALLGNPKILILDEATSSVDLGTETKIQKALNTLLKNRTTFIIAHRLSTLRNADRLVVINNNVIAEMGTHKELMKKQGIYYDFIMTQTELVQFQTN